MAAIRHILLRIWTFHFWFSSAFAINITDLMLPFSNGGETLPSYVIDDIIQIASGKVPETNLTSVLFELANAKFQQLYHDHITYVAEGHCVKKGEIACEHFHREPISPLINKLYNDSLTTVIACAANVVLSYPSFGRNLTNYEKTEHFCNALDDDVERKLKCNLLSNNKKCDPYYPYRTINGYCNNFKNPKWGAQLTPYGRLINGNFDDGGRAPRKSTYNYQDLPRPRFLGNILYHNNIDEKIKSKSNYLAVMFGQFIAHDCGERAYYQLPPGGPDFQACTSDNKNILPADELAFGVVPIEIPANDPFLSKYKVGCLNFVRTQPMYRNDCKFTCAEFTNTRTHFLDCSNIYGSVNETAFKLREFKNGKLKINQQKILPREKDAPNSEYEHDDYFSAELRSTPFYTLAIIHSIFTRLHNLIAVELLKLNPKWSDEKIYQETRRIVIALNQHIVYSEWIPTVLGTDFAEKYNLYSRGQHCGNYDARIDPSALNEFSHAAYRQYHKIIPKKFNFYDESFKIYKTVPLYETDNGPRILEKEYNAVLLGLLIDPHIHGPSSFDDTMRNKIFDNDNPLKLGLDLTSSDLLVGRDQGLSPYHMYLEKFFGIIVNDWNDLSMTIPKKNIEKLKKVYAGVKDLDLYVGLALEHRDYGSYRIVGPVGKHILGEQFQRSKFGDRFFYCLKNNGNPFTLDQLKEINQMSLARILCQTVTIDKMLPNAFETPSIDNNWTSCKQFKTMNLNAWKEKKV